MRVNPIGYAGLAKSSNTLALGLPPASELVTPPILAAAIIRPAITWPGENFAITGSPQVRTTTRRCVNGLAAIALAMVAVTKGQEDQSLDGNSFTKRQYIAQSTAPRKRLSDHED
jgi:hypothetical protein